MEKEIKKKSNYYFIANYKPKNNNEAKTKILNIKFIERNRNKWKIIYKNKIYD